MAANEVVTSPRIIVLGGTGFIGRNFVHYVVSNKLASKVRVVDKVPPQMAWLNDLHKTTFADPVVEFKHSNLINSGSVTNAFNDDSGPYDYVVNCAAETKYGQTETVYKAGIVQLSMNCAREAERRNVKFYVELSSGQMTSPDKKPSKEDTKYEPWTHLAQHKLEVEGELEKLSGLRYAVMRPAIVYGLGDKTGLTPRLIIGAIYKYIKQKMKMLWTKDLKMNTVHVHDLCRAIWHVLQLGKSGEVYHCVDQGETTQGLVSERISDVFGIQYEFIGSLKSNLARVAMTQVVEDINDKHMRPWSEACIRDNITNTPLNPFIDQELLYNKNLYLDGSKLEETGFKYEKPQLQADSLREVLNDYVQMGLFPTSILSGEVTQSLLNSDEDDNDEEDDIESQENVNDMKNLTLENGHVS